MAKIDVLDILRAKRCTPAEFDFDSLWIPPINYYLSPQDIEELRKIATSLKLSSKINQKYELIDQIMRPRGFKRFSAGTNRVVYSFLEDDRFVVKIAVDRVGMQDNPMEYKNQFLLKPYVSKMFYHSPCGTVGFVERVLPIKSKAEFREIAGDVFDILVHKILGEYVMEDIGTKYFMNYGVRKGHAPVLLDYPYLYKLDGNKLYCTKQDPITGVMCNGEIDYDAGFNHLVCNRCGKIYLASDLRDNSIDNKIIIKRGGNQMQVVIKKGDKIIGTPVQVDDVMVRPKSKTSNVAKGLEITITDPKKGSVDISSTDIVKNEESKPKCKYNFGVEVSGKKMSIDSKNVESPKSKKSADANKSIDEKEGPKLESKVVEEVKTTVNISSTTSEESEEASIELKEEISETFTPSVEIKSSDNAEEDNETQDSIEESESEEENVTVEMNKTKVDSINKNKSSIKKTPMEDLIDEFESQYENTQVSQKIRKKPSRQQRERDERGRFVSSKKSENNRSKSRFIPEG